MIIADDDGWEETKVELEEDIVPVDSDEANAMSGVNSDHSEA
jgi:hypothetical protein